MKLIPKSLIRTLLCALALVLLVLLVLPVVQPSAQAAVVVVDPGKMATVTLEYTDACAIEGEIVFSDPSVIEGEPVYKWTGSGMKGAVENGYIFLYAENTTGASGTIEVTFATSATAPKGSSCVVSFKCAITSPGSAAPGAVQTVSHTVTLSTGTSSSSGSSASGSSSNSSSSSSSNSSSNSSSSASSAVTSTPAQSTPSNSTASNSNSTQAPPAPTPADTTALKEQIAAAEALTYYDYTKETWDVVAQTLETAEGLLNSTSQPDVDNATAALKAAIEALVPMDYTALQEALDKAAAMDSPKKVRSVWSNFMSAFDAAREQRTAGDQAAADAAAEQLNKSYDKLQKRVQKLYDASLWEPSWIGSTVILVVMILSLIANLILIILLARDLIKKHLNKKDTTPLVEYDIAEDAPPVNDDLLEYDLGMDDFPEEAELPETDDAEAKA